MPSTRTTVAVLLGLVLAVLSHFGGPAASNTAIAGGSTVWSEQTVPQSLSGEARVVNITPLNPGDYWVVAGYTWKQGVAGETTTVFAVSGLNTATVVFTGTLSAWPSSWLRENGFAGLPKSSDIGLDGRNWQKLAPAGTPAGLVLQPNVALIQDVTPIYKGWNARLSVDCSQARQSVNGEERVLVLEPTKPCVAGFYTYQPGISLPETASVFRFESTSTSIVLFSGSTELYGQLGGIRYPACNSIAGTESGTIKVRNWQFLPPMGTAAGLQVWSLGFGSSVEESTAQYMNCTSGIEPNNPSAFLPLVVR